MAKQVGCTVAELGERMSAEELMEWSAFESIDLDPHWYMFAGLRLQIARMMGDKKTRLEDLVPKVRKPKPKGGVRGAIAAWAASCGAALKRPTP